MPLWDRILWYREAIGNKGDYRINIIILVDFSSPLCSPIATGHRLKARKWKVVQPLLVLCISWVHPGKWMNPGLGKSSKRSVITDKVSWYFAFSLNTRWLVVVDLSWRRRDVLSAVACEIHIHLSWSLSARQKEGYFDGLILQLMVIITELEVDFILRLLVNPFPWK